MWTRGDAHTELSGPHVDLIHSRDDTIGGFAPTQWRSHSHLCESTCHLPVQVSERETEPVARFIISVFLFVTDCSESGAPAASPGPS